MTSKYELTTETKSFSGTTLRRVKALRDIPRHGVNAGDLGGWIEKVENLSQAGECWVGGDARVWDSAHVGDNAHVWDSARVEGDAHVGGNANVWGNARVWDSARVWGNASVGGNARVWDSAHVGDNAHVWGNASVGDNARVWDSAYVGGNARVWGNARVGGDARVWDSARVEGDARVGGNANVWGNASVCDPQHCITVGPVGSESITVTIYRTSDGHQVLAGCWGPGTLDELRAEVKRRERDKWAHRDPADVGRWTAQYKHIGLLGEALVASWDVERADEETAK